MKKLTRNLIFIGAGLLAAGILYYIYLPAINIHSASFWYFIMGLILVCMGGQEFSCYRRGTYAPESGF